MKDIKKQLADLINAAIKPVKVELANPHKQTAKKLPTCTILEVGNATKLVLGGEERLAQVAYQLDVYDSTTEGCERLSELVNAVMIKAGFTRQSGTVEYRSVSVVRKAMRFFGTLDEHTNHIYK